MSNLTDIGIEEIFGEKGLLAKSHANYEFREGQIKMAQAVLDAFESKSHLIVEAGTGTGKTLAYLIPSIAAALSSGKKVIISTGTKNLQEQLMETDIPFLKKMLPGNFKAAYMKGRSNYACIYKITKAADQPVLEGLDEIDYFEEVQNWIEHSETGDRAELIQLPENLSFWNRINAKSETCIGQKCPDYEPCFVTRMRAKAEEADVVVVNHHLFFADLNVRGNEYGRVIPDYDSVVFDEAHLIEDIAADYFGFQVSSYQMEELVRDARSLPIPDATAVKSVARSLNKLNGFSDIFWSRFKDGRGRDGRFPLDSGSFFRRESDGTPAPTPLGEAYYHLDKSLSDLESIIAGLSEDSPESDSVLRRTMQVRFNLDFIANQTEKNYVYWFDRRGRGLYLRASPIDVSGLLTEKLFEKVDSAVLTSATLSSAGRFDYIKNRLGLADARSLLAPSSFDFRSQALVYLPKSIPEPKSPDFTGMAAEEILKLIEITQGRAFVLCTSFYGMNGLYEYVSARTAFPCFLQGSMAKTALLDKYKSTPNAVLFATSSFWQGVDVQGDQLSCVVIDKLPFAVPTDPVVAARSRFIDEQGGRSFFEYSVPNAIIALKQGIGRLIRSAEDIGVIALLDSRLRTKSYGREFLASLPNAPVTTEIEDVRKFFGNEGTSSRFKVRGSDTDL